MIRRLLQGEADYQGLAAADPNATKLYGLWQTTSYNAPAALDGKVPKNERGNVQVPPFVSAMPTVSPLQSSGCRVYPHLNSRTISSTCSTEFYSTYTGWCATGSMRLDRQAARRQCMLCVHVPCACDEAFSAVYTRTLPSCACCPRVTGHSLSAAHYAVLAAGNNRTPVILTAQPSIQGLG